MKYSVDQIINDTIILENLDTKEKLEINKNTLNFKIEEGNIIIKTNNTYQLDKQTEEQIRKRISEKLKKLKELKNE